MNLTDLVPLFEKYGVGGVIFLVGIFLVYTLFTSEWFVKHIFEGIKKLLNRKSEKDSETRVITDSDILNHDLFSFIDLWKYSKIPTIKFSTDYRTIVFRIYLTMYLAKYKSEIMKYVQSGEYKKMDDSQLWKSILSLINSIIYEYEKEIFEAGIPSIIIEKMKAKNNETVLLTIDLVEGICTSNFYDSTDNLLKVYSILNIMLSVLQNTIYTSEQTCNSINGQLKGLEISRNGITYKE